MDQARGFEKHSEEHEILRQALLQGSGSVTLPPLLHTHLRSRTSPHELIDDGWDAGQLRLVVLLVEPLELLPQLLQVDRGLRLLMGGKRLPRARILRE
jgi:hypothetical protein